MPSSHGKEERLGILKYYLISFLADKKYSEHLRDVLKGCGSTCMNPSYLKTAWAIVERSCRLTWIAEAEVS